VAIEIAPRLLLRPRHLGALKHHLLFGLALLALLRRHRLPRADVGEAGDAGHSQRLRHHVLKLLGVLVEPLDRPSPRPAACQAPPARWLDCRRR
jgi:hypothetical protein